MVDEEGVKTYPEIVARIKEVMKYDLFGDEYLILMEFLPWEHLKEFLNLKKAKEDECKPVPLTREAVEATIRDYLPFAWDKANNCRGLSAARSIGHMRAWLFVLGEDQAVKALEKYTLYGKPQLRAISEKFGFPWKEHDDNCWKTGEEDDGIPASEVPELKLPWKEGDA